jgi:enamine deaminase RidA (YjgF/YER057c/UK114 family)
MTMTRRNVSSGSPFKPRVGMSRAVRLGPIITVAGTAPLSEEGHTVGIGDPAAQAHRCLETIQDAFTQAGAEGLPVVARRR